MPAARPTVTRLGRCSQAAPRYRVAGGEHHDGEPSNSQARTVLPIPDKAYAGPILYDAKDPNVGFPPIQPLLPPEGAPNVLVILIDDVGFGAGQRRSAARARRRTSRSSPRSG